MATLPNSKTVSYEEWLRMPEVSDAIEEVVNGEIRIMPPAKWKHSLIIKRLCKELEAQLNDNEVLVQNSVFGLIIRKHPLTSRVPDLAVFKLKTIIELDGYIHSAPQLLVEVLSPGNARREREEKLSDYASIGVPEVWFVSPKQRTVEVYYLSSGSLRSAQVATQGVLKPTCFPGVEVAISGIWPN